MYNVCIPYAQSAEMISNVLKRRRIINARAAARLSKLYAYLQDTRPSGEVSGRGAERNIRRLKRIVAIPYTCECTISMYIYALVYCTLYVNTDLVFSA